MSAVLAAAQGSSDFTWPDVAGAAVAALFVLGVLWLLLRDLQEEEKCR